MATSGVGVDKPVAEEVTKMQLKRHAAYLIFKIDESGRVVIDARGDKGASYDAFCAALPAASPRFAVYDLAFENSDGCKMSKLVFFAWSPEGAPMRDKMMYASTKATLVDALSGRVQVTLQANDADDLDLRSVLPKCGTAGARMR